MDPEYTTRVLLRNGHQATIRPLQAGDVEPLAALFLSLSEDTKRRYGPHPFDRATAGKLCAEIDPATTLRFVALLEGEPQPQIIGYMILTRQMWSDDVQRYGDWLRTAECGALAPVVADAYQDQGIGSQMARHVLASARLWGLSRVVLMGGVQGTNARARHFYTKLGFREVGEFWTHHNGDMLNYLMIVDL